MNNNINPAIQELKEFIGTWEMEISNASFLSDPKEIIKATASFQWFEDGEFLILRQGTKKKETPWAVWLISRDKDSSSYSIFYMDDQQSSRVYEMSFESSIWKIWRNGPEFKQRFTAEVNRGKTIITGHWERSKDGQNWDHDFDLTYKRTK